MQNTDTRKEMCCPLNGKMCIDGRREDFPKDKTGNSILCRWWVHLFGKDPQSEKIIDQFDCAVAWMPTIQTETSQMERHTTASVDKLANITDGLKSNIGMVGKGLMAVADRSQEALELKKKEIDNNGTKSP